MAIYKHGRRVELAFTQKRLRLSGQSGTCPTSGFQVRYNCALFTMTFLSMLAGAMGREVGWELGVAGAMVSQLAS